MKTSFFATLFLWLPFTLAAQPQDAANPQWEKEIPRVVYPEQELVDLYEKTWQLASERVRIGPEGLPASPYLDENCYDDQIWIWDACFMVMFSKYAPVSYPGWQTLNNLYIPIHENQATPLRIHWRDNPPLFAWVEYNNYIFSGNRKQAQYVLLEKQYLQRHFQLFNSFKKGDVDERISPNPIAINPIKDSENKILGFTWTGVASGMDNTPRGRDAGGYTKILWVDAIAQQALSALYISRLAEELGNKKETRLWKRQYEDLKETINQKYWDPQDGFYYDISCTDGTPCRIKTPASFWPMLAEIPDRKQAESMVRYLRSEQWLGGKYPWPSLARDDRDYQDKTGDYWKGGVWLPMVYMGTKALEKYGYYDLADSLAERVVRQQLRTYHEVTPHTIWECYSPSSDSPSTEYGRRARQDFCGWSALGPISLFIENILGFREVNALEKFVRWDLKPQKGTQGIRNLKFGNICTDIIYQADDKKIEVKSNAPYRLIVNGNKYRIKKGDNIFIYRQ